MPSTRRAAARTSGGYDFGDPKFGQSADRPHIVGRRADVWGRAIPAEAGGDPVQAVRAYLAAGATETAQRLAQEARKPLHHASVVRSRLLRQKVSVAIGAEKVLGTDEQVHARHILLAVGLDFAPGTVADGAAHGPYPDAAALALANELRGRILEGEDFGTLARTYSYDTGSAANGGDLGWFGKGRMVAPFEAAAFSLPLNEVSEPVKTDFGYHLIEVLEKDPARPKDEAQLQQERTQAYQAWLAEKSVGDQVKRAGNLLDFMPRGTRAATDAITGAGAGVSADESQPAVVEPDVLPDWIDGAALGDPNAPLEVQIWVDYLCPACQVFAAGVEPQLVEQYVEPGKIRLTIHFFPLQQHEPGATLAALAAACAAEQDRFWPYHWYLMAMIKQEGHAAATFENLNAYASEAGLDAGAFESCLAEKKQAGVIAASAAEAQALNLQFVPSVSVGDALLQDSSFESVKAEIERQLQ